MIYVIEDDPIMRECIIRACGKDVKTQGFSNAIDAMAAISDTNVAETPNATNVAETPNATNVANDTNVAYLPSLIFLDILLTGPDGFTFLNELVSYTDTAKIPIVIVTSLDLTDKDLRPYGVVGILSKDQMHPEDIRNYVKQYATK